MALGAGESLAVLSRKLRLPQGLKPRKEEIACSQSATPALAAIRGARDFQLVALGAWENEPLEQHVDEAEKDCAEEGGGESSHLKARREQS